MKTFRKIAMGFVVAFSLYSRIPMPKFDWRSEDMEYHLCFFPLIGLVIGALEWALWQVAALAGLGDWLRLCLALAIPLIVTGGFHLDGFMDTMDARSSYGDREKKLEILKDPHIGAFSVISLAMYLLVAFGFLSEIREPRMAFSLCFIFMMSRIFSAASVISFPAAKKDGMLVTFASTAAANVVRAVLVLEFLLCAAAMVVFSPIVGGILIVVTLLCFAYYYLMSKRLFGGITGDLAGFFVCITELAAVVAVGICSIIM